MAILDGSGDQSNAISTPMSDYSANIRHQQLRTVAYNGQLLTRFLQDKGGDPTTLRSWLYANRVGRIFDGGLQAGQLLTIPQSSSSFKPYGED